MPVISSAGALVELERRSSYALSPSAVVLYNNLRQTYAQIVAAQPNVRTVISFLARNVAQLGIHLYRRVSDTDRQRVTGHPFTAAIKKPNPLDRRMTRYRLIHGTVSDLCAYDAAFWGLVATPAGRPGIVRLPPEQMRVVGDSWLWPEGYELRGNRGTLPLQPDQVVHFQGSLNLADPFLGLSPIETLRRILAEEASAGEYREQYWRSGARISGVIERPATAPPWSNTARGRFRSEWSEAYTGSGPGAGGTPILEDGMAFKETAGTARDAQYVESRKLTREECAAAYHVHPAFVGILENANFSNMREQHRSLYMDTLGPIVVMLEEDLEAQALPAFATPAELDDLYVEFNVAEKLRGSVEELADSINRLVGRPVLTANEGRALLNRNELPEGEGLTLPLNVIVGGQTIPGATPPATASQVSENPERKPLLKGPNGELAGAHLSEKKALAVSRRLVDALRSEHELAHRLALAKHLARQGREVLSELGAKPGATADELFDRRRFDTELAGDLFTLAKTAAGDIAEATAEALAFDALDLDAFEPYLLENATYAAANVNANTIDKIASAITDIKDTYDLIKDIFDGTPSLARVTQFSTTRVTGLFGFGSTSTARQAGRPSKVWRVNSQNPRPSHAGVNGETVPLGSLFSIGGAWPGDPTLGVDEIAGCTCSVEFT